MKIAQLAPPWLPVPPLAYGGTELIIDELTQGLLKKGHEVTLFATGDSRTSAKLSYIYEKAIGDKYVKEHDALAPLLHYIECFDRANEFDIIHNHAQYYAMFLADLVKTPVVHTIHGSYSPEYTKDEKVQTLKRFKDHNFVSISNSQRGDLPELNYVGTVYNGIDIEKFTFSEKSGDYLLWLGRITPKKGPIEAIKVAQALGMRLKIVAKIDPIEQDFFDNEVKPLIDGDLISFYGEVLGDQKIEFYKNALCTLYPIHWNEPFGLVMAESMACGTPVIAYNQGSVPEVVVDGKSGFIVGSDTYETDKEFIVKEKGVPGLLEAVKRIHEINRYDARKHVEENFSKSKMVNAYEQVYKDILRI